MRISKFKNLRAFLIDHIDFPNGFGKPFPGGYPLIILISFVFISVIIAPYLTSSDSVVLSDKGNVGEYDNSEEIADIQNPFSRSVYRIGDRLCHQKPSRSFYLNGNQMPFCARDIGIFGGMLIGSILGCAYFGRNGWLFFFLSLIPMTLDGGIQLLTDYESNNIIRVATGCIAGTGIGFFININLAHFFKMLFFKSSEG